MIENTKSFYYELLTNNYELAKRREAISGCSAVGLARPDWYREGSRFEKMYYLYIIQSIKNGKYYIGATKNIDRRLDEHNRGKSKSTKNFVPYKLIYKENFNTLLEARKREYYIKLQKSKKFIESLIKWGVA